MLLDGAAPRQSRPWMRLVYAGLALGLIAAVVAIVLSFTTKGESKKRNVVYQIAVLRPPPPPPPPKPEEKIPEPEIEEKVKLPEPDMPPDAQQAEAPPAGQDLGVDAQGTGAGDSFGLVGKPGGTDITKIGGGGGADRAQYAFFSGMLQQHFSEQLNRHEKLKSRDYKVVISVWLSADGRVRRAELAGSSGNEETDDAIRTALTQMAPMPEPPPQDMPQPVRMRMVSRGAG